MQADQLEVTKLLDVELDELVADSIEVFGKAHLGYQQQGRGAMAAVFRNIDAITSERGYEWYYLNRSVLETLEYPPVMQFVDSYDPEAHFVAIAVVNITRPKADRPNAIMLCKRIAKYIQLITSTQSISVPQSYLTMAQRTGVLACAMPDCGVTEGLRVCGGCNDARYCSRDCQTAHRSAHKEACRVAKAAKAEAKALLRS
jgi:MYND finger